MAVLDIAGKIKGYVVVCAEGYFTERFLNVCMRRGIFLWNVRRAGDTRIFACMGIQDFKNIRPIAAKTRTKVKIVKRCGMPFFVHRYRHRKTAVIGIALFFAVLWYFSGHVIGIDITGNERISTEAVINELKGFGVYHGANINKLDNKLIQNQMMTKMEDIAWIGVNIKGSRVYIEIKERLDTHINLEKDIPCNIVAAKDGIVRTLEVKAGQSMIKSGQMVEKGDLLVSGAVDSNREGVRYIHSFGEIYADTIYKREEEYPLEYTKKIYTGAEKKRYSVKILGKEIKLVFNQDVPFEFYDSSTEDKEYRLPIDFIPALYLITDKYSEYIPEKCSRTEGETVEIAKKELCERLNTEIPSEAEIKKINVAHTITDKNTVLVTVEYECREDIAVQTPIDKIENIDYDITKTKP